MRVSGYKNPICLIRTASATVFCPVISPFLILNHENFLRLLHSRGFKVRVAALCSGATFPPFCSIKPRFAVFKIPGLQRGLARLIERINQFPG